MRILQASTTLILCLLLMITQNACANRNESDDVYGHHSNIGLKNAVLCDCLYKVRNMNTTERILEGSLGAFIEAGYFGIDELEHEMQITDMYLDTVAVTSKHHSTLEIFKCLNRMILFDESKYINGMSGKK